MKHQFRALNDDEIDFLDSELESERAREAAVRKEVSEQLQQFRKQQEDAEKAAVGEVNEPAFADESTEWVPKGKKRRKSHGKESLIGVKLRKTSSATESEQRPASKSAITSDRGPTGTAEGAIGKPKGSNESTVEVQTSEQADNALDRAVKPGNASPPTGGLGLGAYSSDEDE